MKYGFLKPEHAEFPPIVHVENTNVCNLRCIHCPQADPYRLVPGYRPESMRLDTFETVAAEVAARRSVLRMTPDGETMLPKEFPAMLRRIVELGTHLFACNTNGLFLEGEVLDLLLSPGRTRIALEVSLDALWRGSYDRIRVGSDYARVLGNVFAFLRERDRRGLGERVKLLVSIIDQPELEPSELEQFERFWTPLADKVIRRTYVDTKALTPKKDTPAGGGAARWENPENVLERWPCLVPFTRLVVTYDGRVRFCPDDWRKETVLGRVGEQSLAELWSGPEMERLRAGHLERLFTHPTCRACTDWKAIRWDYDYLVALRDLFGDEAV